MVIFSAVVPIFFSLVEQTNRLGEKAEEEEGEKKAKVFSTKTNSERQMRI